MSFLWKCLFLPCMAVLLFQGKDATFQRIGNPHSSRQTQQRRKCEEVDLIQPDNGGRTIAKHFDFPNERVLSIRLLRKTGTARCVLGQTYGNSIATVYTKQGCQGTFQVCLTTTGASTPVPPTGTSRDEECRPVSLVSTGSTKIHRVQSGVEILEVTLTRDRSSRGRKCFDGQTFFWNIRTLSVRGGCSGLFSVCVRSVGGSGGGQGGGGGVVSPQTPVNNQGEGVCRQINLRSRNGGRDEERSRTGRIRSLTLEREYSRGRCVRDRTYGFVDDKAFATGDCQGRFNLCTGEDTGHQGEEVDEREKEEEEGIVTCDQKRVVSIGNRERRVRIRGSSSNRQAVVIKTVEVVNQLSRVRCTNRNTFFFRQDELVVRRGCGAWFRICYERESSQTSEEAESGGLPDALPVKSTCEEVQLHSFRRSVDEFEVRAGRGKVPFITKIELLRERTRNLCREWDTYYGADTKLIARNGCSGRFRVCHGVYSF